MSDNYERRVRKGVEDLAKLDPEFAALNQEETIKEAAAGLRKAETAWGGPGSSGPSFLELAKAPFTGRLNGIEVERGLWPWGLILLQAVGAIVAPILGLIQWVGFWNLSRSGYDANVSDAGVEVFSKRKGRVALYAWADIAQLRSVFQPPLTFWEIVLSSGATVSLHLADLDPAAFRARGITVHEKSKFRTQYEDDG